MESLLVDAIKAAEITGIPSSTLHRWARDRERGMKVDAPVHVKFEGKRRMWERKELVRWIETRRI